MNEGDAACRKAGLRVLPANRKKKKKTTTGCTALKAVGKKNIAYASVYTVIALLRDNVGVSYPMEGIVNDPHFLVLLVVGEHSLPQRFECAPTNLCFFFLWPCEKKRPNTGLKKVAALRQKNG